MKIKSNSDIVKIIEEFYHDRNELYYSLFDKALEYENLNNNNIQFQDFLSIAKNIEDIITLHKYNSALSFQELIAAPFCVYNWGKYRVIYDITNPDKTISRFSNEIEKDVFNNIFYNDFFIKYDYPCEYIGCFVSIQTEYIYMTFLYYDKEKKLWSSEPVYFKTNISNVNNSIDETLFQNYDALYLAITQKTFDKIKLCSQITLQIIYAINAGYKNNQRLTIDQSETNNSSNQLIHTEKIRIRKSQVLFVERESIVSSESFRNYKRSNKSSPKCPHTRRAGIRKKKIYDSDGNIIGYKQIKYKSCIIHKEQYVDTVPKKLK